MKDELSLLQAQLTYKKRLEAMLRELKQQQEPLSKKVKELEARMADPETYKDPAAAQNLAREHRESQDALEKLYEDWEELSEAVAELP